MRAAVARSAVTQSTAAPRSAPAAARAQLKLVRVGPGRPVRGRKRPGYRPLANRLSECSAEGVYRAVIETLAADPEWDCPYGDGDAAERILDRLPVSAEREELVR